MSEVENYNRLKLALEEVETLSLVIVRECFDRTERKDTTGRCRYVLDFSNGSRSLEFTEELVDMALTDTLGHIQESIRFHGRQLLSKQKQLAREELEKKMLFLEEN